MVNIDEVRKAKEFFIKNGMIKIPNEPGDNNKIFLDVTETGITLTQGAPRHETQRGIEIIDESAKKLRDVLIELYPINNNI